MRACRTNIAETLAAEVLPFVMSILDRRALLEFAERELDIGENWLEYGADLARLRIVLCIDDGPSAIVEREIAQLEHEANARNDHDPMVVWARNRTTRHQQQTG